jgi:predicted nucleic acid-binding protein
MGLILDTSVLIEEEHGRFDMPQLLDLFSGTPPVIAAITAAELLHGVERASDPARRAKRQRQVENVLASVFIAPFDLLQARVYAQIWAGLARRGLTMESPDLQIAAAAIVLGHQVATLNVRDFQRVPALKVIDASPYLISAGA